MKWITFIAKKGVVNNICKLIKPIKRYLLVYLEFGHP